MDTLNGLKQFYSDLKTYKDMIEYLAKSKMILGHEIGDRDELREKLVRKTGVFKNLITELTGKQYFTQNMIKYDIWDEAFNPTSGLPTSSSRNAVAFCINAVNEAIGKLQKQQEEVSYKGSEDLFAAFDNPEKAIQQKGGEQDLTIKLFDAMQFHPKVVEASTSCFTTINYREAILNAFISLTDYIKEISGLDLDGDDLMNNVFSFNYDKEQRKITKYPLIRINELKSKTDRDEQQGFMFLCKGAAAFVRNPKAHKLIVQTDPLHTLEYLAFASMLFKQLDKRVQIPQKEHSS